MTIQAEETTYLDALAASIGYETNNLNNTNMIAYDRLAGQIQTAVMPPYDYGSGTNATLAENCDLGEDLMRELGVREDALIDLPITFP